MNNPLVFPTPRVARALGIFILVFGGTTAAAQTYTFTTVAGSPGQAGSADGTGSAALFNYPVRLAVDAMGNIYVADYFNHTIRKITSAGVVTTLAGLAGSPGATDGTGNAARLHYPGDIALDPDGNLYVPEFPNHTIRKITPEGVVTTLAGLAGVPGSVDGTGGAARFNQPFGVGTDGTGNIYVADSTNSTLRKITNGGVVTTLAGLAGAIGSLDGTGSDARFHYPADVAVGGAGIVYVADRANHTIRQILTGGAVSTLAGAAGVAGSTDSIGGGARFNHPYGIAADSSGTLYIADTYNNTIRRIALGGIVTTVGGSPGSSGSTDGTGSEARFNLPHGLAVDRDYNIYVADYYNHTIRKGTPSPGRPVLTSATSASAVFGQGFSFMISATNSPTDFDALGLPSGLAVEHATGLISGSPAQTGVFTVAIAASNVTGSDVADLVLSIAKASASITLGNIAQTYDGSPKPVTVSTSPAGLTTDVLYDQKATAPTNAGTYGVVATVTDQNYAGSAAGTLVISKANATVGLSNLTQPGDGTPKAVAVSTTPAGLNTLVTYNGSTTPPTLVGSYSVVATVVDPNHQGTAEGTLTITDSVPLQIVTQPTDTVAIAGQTATFSVTARASLPISYQWYTRSGAISGGTDRTLVIQSVETADEDDYRVVVSTRTTSLGSTWARLDVIVPPAITQQPEDQIVSSGRNATFTARASGTGTLTYQWRRNGTVISGATSNRLQLRKVTPADAGDYDVVVTNEAGLAVSNLATLTVTAPSQGSPATRISSASWTVSTESQ